MTIVQNFYHLWLGHVDYRMVVSVSWSVQTDPKNLLLKKLEKKINCHDLIPGKIILTILVQCQRYEGRDDTSWGRGRVNLSSDSTKKYYFRKSYRPLVSVGNKISHLYFFKIFLASTDWTCLHTKVTINWKKRFFMRFEKPEDSDKSNDDVICCQFKRLIRWMQSNIFICNLCLLTDKLQ